jgi:hypothetical protein
MHGRSIPPPVEKNHAKRIHPAQKSSTEQSGIRTNIALTATSWTRITTNSFNTIGGFIHINVINQKLP